jgi:antitoxin component of RelBE/YafQ-DinJ toxin-antitoxin module
VLTVATAESLWNGYVERVKKGAAASLVDVGQKADTAIERTLATIARSAPLPVTSLCVDVNGVTTLYTVQLFLTAKQRCDACLTPRKHVPPPS